MGLSLLLNKVKTTTINQIFINIFLPKNTRLRMVYKYKFSETKARPNENTLGL
jgi:hypothetical protein